LKTRDILVRFYLKEQSQEQICREMSLTETQFRLRKSRAKEKFNKVVHRELSSKALRNLLSRLITGSAG